MCAGQDFLSLFTVPGMQAADETCERSKDILPDLLACSHSSTRASSIPSTVHMRCLGHISGFFLTLKSGVINIMLFIFISVICAGSDL